MTDELERQDVDSSPDSAEDLPVVLFPHDDGRIAVLGERLPSWFESTAWLPAAIDVARQLAGSGGESRIGGRVFTIRPEDEAAYERLRTIAAGRGYVRGTLRDDRGFAHQMAFREAQAPASAPAAPPVDPLMLAMAAQLVAIQEQLVQIEDQLEDLSLSVESIKDLLERDHAAQAAAAVAILSDVAETTRQTGRVTGADWDRIATLDHTLRHRLIACVDELESFASRLEFRGDLRADHQLVKELSPERWEQLLQQTVALEHASFAWIASYALKLQQDGEFDPDAIERSIDTISELLRRRDAARTAVLAAADSGPHASRRSNLELLLTTGIPKGRAIDRNRLDALKEFRGSLSSASQEIARPGLESGLRLSEVAAPS